MGDAISSLLFQPPPANKLKESKLVWLDTSRGERIPGTYITSPGAKLTFLYSHANAEDLGNIYPWCKFLSRSLKVNLFAYDYSGYGLSSGEPSEENCYADITAAYDYLTEVRGIAPENIVLYGRSLGSGPSCYLAMKTAQKGPSKSVGGLILHAPFLSIYRVVIDTKCTLLGDKFPNIDYAPHVRCPVFLIHGTKDSIVPFSHSEQLYEQFPKEYIQRPFFVKGMGHNQIHQVLRPVLVKRLTQFLETAKRIKRKGDELSDYCSDESARVNSTGIVTN